MEEMKKPGIMDGAGEWDESEHPRDGDGKFANGSDGRGNKPTGESNVTSRKANNNHKKYNLPKPKEFHNSITAAKESNLDDKKWRVDVHNEFDYSKDKLFTTDGGSCVAIEPTGNIVSLCKNMRGGERGIAKALLEKAVAEGGDRLDAFGEDLYITYTKNGFEPVSYTPFNEQYAPKGWKSEYGKEPVIFYRYVDKAYAGSFDDFINNCAPSASYDEAKQIRDRRIKK